MPAADVQPRWRRRLYFALTGLLPAALLTLLVLATLIVSAFEFLVLDPNRQVKHLASAGTFQALSASAAPGLARERFEASFTSRDRRLCEEAEVWTRRIFTPDWFERYSSELLVAVHDYAYEYRDGVGETREGHTITLGIAGRLDAVGVVISERMDESPLATVAWEALIDYAAVTIAERQAQTSFGFSSPLVVWQAVLREVAPKLWVAANLARGVQGSLDWLLGRRPQFLWTLPLNERQGAVVEAVKTLVRQSNLGELIREQALRPALVEQLDDRVLIDGTDIEVTRDELIAVLDPLVDTDWAHAQRDAVAAGIADFLVSRRADLAVQLDLIPARTLAADRIATFIGAKVQRWLATRATCTGRQLARVLIGLDSPLACAPRGRESAVFDILLSAFVREQVFKVIDDNVGSKWTLTLDPIRDAVPRGVWELIVRARSWFRSGLTIDEGDLRQLLDSPVLPPFVTSARLDELVRLAREGVEISLAPVFSEAQGELDAVRFSLSTVESARLPTLGLMASLTLLLLLRPSLRRRTRLRLVALALVAGPALALTLSQFTSDRIGPFLVEILTEDASSLGAYWQPVIDTIPKAAEGLAKEASKSVADAAYGVAAAGVLLLGLSWLVPSAHKRLARRPVGTP